MKEHATPWHEYTEHSQRYRIRAEYGFTRIGNQAPYFSLTGEIQRGPHWSEDSCGMLHDDIAKHFPRLRPLIKWHLCAWTPEHPCLPMHYQANALYWLEKHLGISKWKRESYEPEPLDAFKSTIVFGALPDDTVGFEAMLSACVASGDIKSNLYAWLDSRLPALGDAFKADMRALNVHLADAF